MTSFNPQQAMFVLETMKQSAQASSVSNIYQSIANNGLSYTNRYIAEFSLPKILQKNFPELINLIVRCSSATIPGRNISTVGYRLYGPARQMPYEILYGGEISLNYILSSDLREREFFERWMSGVVNNGNYKMGFYDDYVGQLTIHILDKTDKIAYTAVVEEVYPKTVGDLAMGGDKENEYMTQEVTFGFRRYTSQFKTKNPQPEPK